MIMKKLALSLVSLYFILCVPVTLTLIGARLLMTPAYLNFEYNRADFPLDFYGFSTADRLHYGPYALDYMVYNHDIRYLGDLKFDDGREFYNSRELSHMVDVQKVAQAAFLVLVALLVGELALFFGLRRNLQVWFAIWRGLIGGSLLTLLILVAAVVAVVVAWDTFFTGFHEVFFANGTWVFEYTDSLIRLYPVRFWQDAAINIGIFAGVGALAILAFCWRRRPLAAAT
jgi:integral membrane protein (TIGR01906 family)